MQPNERLEELISRHLDGVIATNEERELAVFLSASPEARAVFASYARLEGAKALLGGIECLEKGASKRKLNAPQRLPARRAIRSARKSNLGWAAAACILAAMGILYVFVGRSQSKAVIARMGACGPHVRIVRDGQPVNAQKNEPLYAQDSVRVPANESASIEYSGETTVLNLGAGCVVALDSGTKGKRIDLVSGALQATVAPQPSGQSMLFITPNASAEVIGTQLSLNTDANRTRLDVTEGHVRFTKGTQSVEVHAQQFAEAALGVELTAHAIVAPLPALATAPPLPTPTGPIRRVATVDELTVAVRTLTSGTTILIAPGTYRLTDTLNIDAVQNVALRGDSMNFNDVVLLGRGIAVRGGAEQGIQALNVQDVMLANLSISDFYDNPIHLQGGAGCSKVRLYNIHCFDSARNFVHATSEGSNRGGVADTRVEYSRFEYTKSFDTPEFVAAINIQNGQNWVISHCEFRNLPSTRNNKTHVPAAIVASNGSRNTLTENNTFMNCTRAIAYGVIERPGFADHSGGIIRNNFIYRESNATGDTGIMVWASPDTSVVHNTVLLNNTYPNAIEYRFPSALHLQIANNLCDAQISARDGAQATLAGNIESAQPAWFADPAKGDLHLRSGVPAIDAGVSFESASPDIDGDLRPQGRAPDVGADEYKK